MTRYLLLNGLVLALIAIAIYAVTSRHKRARLYNKAWWQSLLVLLAMTAVFDSFIVGAGIVAYDTTKILGIIVYRAPIEDFAYIIATAVMVPVLWDLNADRREQRRSRDEPPI